ncbi:hypothetical protein [Thermoanaerobacter siderophilus]|uniref:Uncharacterized protein n=1 Tax=Thermoanaerobacter siderophilus SR4 TaxID=880478 RepID=I9AD19_9THEO|nr:hypothetical protein [Thermoanaerobacter siderophilus]EIV99901.1 hypothetical protein ThesiDRAFT1_0917 [Thermoanaerobacter siderophilus SR4]
MNGYYLLTGYIVFSHDVETKIKGKTNKSKINKDEIYRSNKQTPENYTFLDLNQSTKIHIAYHKSWHGFLGNFVIESDSMAEAYYLADIIRVFYSVFYGWIPPETISNFYLKNK